MTPRYTLSLFIGASLCLLAADRAVAQTGRCAAHDVIVAQLAERYGEARQVIALGADNAVVEVFAASSGSWSITVTRPGGPTCLVAAGQNYSHVAEALPDTDEPA